MNLDETLAAWAVVVRLPDAAAADIYQQIVAEPARPSTPAADGPGLDPTWWRTFTTQLTADLVAATRPVDWAA
jgi:hypothetical protein